MNLLTIQNLPCIPAVALGAIAIGKGCQDFKNNHKLSGIAKMVFGVSLAGAACGYAVYQSIPIPTPPLVRCSPKLSEMPGNWHPSCPKIIELVQDALQKGELKNLYKPEEAISPLTKEMFLPESISCDVKYGNELDCTVTVKEKGNLDVATWLPPSDRTTLDDAFKAIPGAELFYRLQVYFAETERPESGVIARISSYIPKFFT